MGTGTGPTAENRQCFASEFSAKVQEQEPDCSISAIGRESRTIVFDRIPPSLFEAITKNNLDLQLFEMGFWRILAVSICGEAQVMDLTFDLPEGSA